MGDTLIEIEIELLDYKDSAAGKKHSSFGPQVCLRLLFLITKPI